MCLMYGMASYNLYQLYQKEIELKQVFKFLLANLISQMVIVLVPLSTMCLSSSTLLFDLKLDKLNEVFQNTSAAYLNNQTRESIHFNQEDVVFKSVTYILINLLVAIGVFLSANMKLKIICKVVDLNNIVNPINIFYRENRESLKKLRRMTMSYQPYYSSVLILFSGLSFHGFSFFLLLGYNCNENDINCALLKEKALRFFIFQCICFVIGLVGLILFNVEYWGSKCGMKCYENLIKSAYIIGDELQWDETERNNADELEAANQTVTYRH